MKQYRIPRTRVVPEVTQAFQQIQNNMKMLERMIAAQSDQQSAEARTLRQEATQLRGEIETLEAEMMRRSRRTTEATDTVTFSSEL